MRVSQSTAAEPSLRYWQLSWNCPVSQRALSSRARSDKLVVKRFHLADHIGGMELLMRTTSSRLAKCTTAWLVPEQGVDRVRQSAYVPRWYEQSSAAIL